MVPKFRKASLPRKCRKAWPGFRDSRFVLHRKTPDLPLISNLVDPFCGGTRREGNSNSTSGAGMRLPKKDPHRAFCPSETLKGPPADKLSGGSSAVYTRLGVPVEAKVDRMTLAQFIRTNSDRILREWEDFANKISDAPLPRWILRDHAPSILKFIADRMEAISSPVEQRLVAAMEGEPSPTQYLTAAHVKIRIDSGFDLAQIAAEYCVLRAACACCASLANA